MYHGEKVTCIVKWESMPEVRNGVCSLMNESVNSTGVYPNFLGVFHFYLFLQTKMKSVVIFQTFNLWKLFCRKSYVINVQYKAQLPNLKPNLAQQEVSCFADGNPEPTIMWTLPDGSVREGTTVEMQVNDFIKYLRRLYWTICRTLAIPTPHINALLKINGAAQMFPRQALNSLLILNLLKPQTWGLSSALLLQLYWYYV